MGKTYAHSKPRKERDISPTVKDGRRDLAVKAARTVASRQRTHWLDRWEADKEDREASAVVAVAYPQSAVQTDNLIEADAYSCGYCGTKEEPVAATFAGWLSCPSCGGV